MPKLLRRNGLRWNVIGFRTSVPVVLTIVSAEIRRGAHTRRCSGDDGPSRPDDFPNKQEVRHSIDPAAAEQQQRHLEIIEGYERIAQERCRAEEGESN